MGITLKEDFEINLQKNIGNLFCEIERALFRLRSELFTQMREEEIRIAMPQYLINILGDSMVPRTNVDCSSLQKKLFGIQLVPHYDNSVVIYHIDAPLCDNSNYKIIKL